MKINLKYMGTATKKLLLTKADRLTGFGTAIVLAIVILSTMVSCENDYYDRVSQNGQGVLLPIIDVLKKNSDFSKFVDLLQKSKVDELLVSGPVYTVFVPTNAAIDAYNAAYPMLSTENMDSAAARTFVEYHISFGIYYKYDYEKKYITDQNNRFSTRLFDADFNQYKQVSVFPEAYFGKMSKFNYIKEYEAIYRREYNPKDSSFFVESAKVITELMDISCSNGVIHGIDAVLKPLNNVFEELNSNPDYSVYASFIQRFDTLMPVLEKGVLKYYEREYWYTDEAGVRQQIVGLDYSNEESDVTLFAPTNEVLNNFFEPYLPNFGGDIHNIPDDIIIDLLQYNQANINYYKSRLYQKDMLAGVRMAVGTEYYPTKYLEDAPVVASNGFIYPVQTLMAPPSLALVTGKILLDPRFQSLRYVMENTGLLSVIANSTYASNDFLFDERVRYPKSWTIIAPDEIVFTDSLVKPVYEMSNAELWDMAAYWVIPDMIYLDGSVEAEFDKGTFVGNFDNGYYPTYFGTMMRKLNNTLYSSVYADSTAQIKEVITGSNGVIYVVDDIPYNMRRSFNIFSQLARYSSEITIIYMELTNGLHSDLLNKELVSSKSDYTLFFPNDKAMKDYDAVAADDPNLKTWEEMDTDERDYFMRNHMIRQRTIIDNQPDTEFYSSVGNKVTLYKHLGQYRLKGNNDAIPGAAITIGNQQASNGVVNIIDNVILP